MEHFIYASIILLGLALFLYLWNNEHRTVREVKKEKEEIEIEEHRMFDFLHGLGEALIEDSSPSNMHRYIVTGVSNVIGGNAGILYLVDAEYQKIVPVSQSRETVPVLALPEELVGEEEKKGAAQHFRSYVRLSPLKMGQGLIGETLDKGAMMMIEDLKDYFQERGSERFHGGVSLLAAPLIYANKPIGVLAISREKSPPFSSNDCDVFESVTEQCAYALGSAIIHAEANEKRRLEQELSQASEIQRILLPKVDPELSDYHLAATYRAARHVSGDYYDYVKIDQDHYGIAIADVCGKGIAASLIMAMSRSSLRSHSSEVLSPASVLQSVNRSIFPDIREDMFVSFFYCVLSRGTNTITVANAGHEPLMIRRISTGEVEVMEVAGIAVGVDEGPVFERVVQDHDVEMETGDILLLYTDGLIEAMNRDGEEFGFDRFRESFRTAQGDTAAEVVDFLNSEIEEFSAGMNATDDITLIAVEKR